MGIDSKQLQFADVVAALSQGDLCTLVHLDTELEVDVWKEPAKESVQWRVRYLGRPGEFPEQASLIKALAAGFQLGELSPGLRPPQYEVYQTFRAAKAAAAGALTIARLLAGVPADAWLWVTSQDHDSRGDPPTPPNPWPPVG